MNNVIDFISRHFLSVEAAGLTSHLNLFSLSLGEMSEKHEEETLQRKKSTTERNPQGRYKLEMIGNVCWMIMRNIPDVENVMFSKKTALLAI